jgi:RimJ/RimL family protein N-acetyltransferase
MSNNPLDAVAVVSNTNPAHLPGHEPLTGKHVTLTRLTPAHFPDLWENVGSHADLWIWWPDGPFSTPSEFDSNMNELLTFMGDDLAVYACLLISGPHKGKAVGLGLVLSKDRDTNRVAELGLFFGPLIQRTRAGTEVVYILAGMMFELNHRRLQWETNSLNLASRQAAERYGFVLEGIFRQAQINKGRNRDTAWYSIIDSEWPVRKEAFEMWLEDGNFDEQGRQRRRLEEIRESLG